MNEFIFEWCLKDKETGEKPGKGTDTEAYGGEGSQQGATSLGTREGGDSGQKVWLLRVASSDQDWPDLPSDT